MDRFRFLILAALLFPAAPAAWAQTGGAAVSPDPALLAPGGKKKKKPLEMTPMALSLALTFDATTWLRVGVSTVTPAADMARFLGRKGLYRLEILQLTLMARETGKKLPELAKRRAKGEPLRKLADDFKLDYDVIYERSLELVRRVERRMENISRVRVFAESSPPRPRGRE